MEMTRREFMKSVGAASLAVAAAGLLSGCGDREVVASATGINDTANMNDIKMTVRSLSYGYDADGTLYVVPEVLIKNGTAAGIPISPDNNSFRLSLNGSTDVPINAETMAFLKSDKTWNALESRTLNLNQQEKGYICGALQNAPDFSYVYVIFYPNPGDTKVYLRCRVGASEANKIKIIKT